MKAKRIILFFLLLSALAPLAHAADFGEDDQYLGQVVDDYENDDYVNVTFQTINNVSLNCMELNYSSVILYENFSSYTEVDALNRLTQTDRRSTFTNINRADNNIYLYDDKGSNYFDDWSCQFELFIDSISVGTTANKYVFVVLGFGTTLGDYLDIRVTGVGFVISTHVATGVSGYFLGIREFDTGSYWNYVDLVEEYDEDVLYYMVLEKSDTRVSLVAYTDSDRTIMKVNQTINLQGDRKMRYIFCPQSMQTAGNFAATGYTQNLTFGAGGGYVNGYYTTIDMIDGGRGLALMYNGTIPAGTGMTLQFFNGSVWVDHNNEAGHDVLTEGYETLDTRDIYPTACPVMVNQTTDGGDTPRMYQLRWVTTTTQPTEGNGDGDSLFPGLAIGISLLIIGAIYALEKRR